VDILIPWVSPKGEKINRANLDVKIRLLDFAGTVLATANPAGNGNATAQLPASLNYAVTSPGSYYLSVAKTGYGNPVTTGYSTYGSVRGGLPAAQGATNQQLPERPALIHPGWLDPPPNFVYVVQVGQYVITATFSPSNGKQPPTARPPPTRPSPPPLRPAPLPPPLVAAPPSQQLPPGPPPTVMAALIARINTYRARHGSPNIRWSTSLPPYAAKIAAQCKWWPRGYYYDDQMQFWSSAAINETAVVDDWYSQVGGGWPSCLWPCEWQHAYIQLLCATAACAMPSSCRAVFTILPVQGLAWPCWTVCWCAPHQQRCPWHWPRSQVARMNWTSPQKESLPANFTQVNCRCPCTD
jgi:hypothetical protein